MIVPSRLVSPISTLSAGTVVAGTVVGATVVGCVVAGCAVVGCVVGAAVVAGVSVYSSQLWLVLIIIVFPLRAIPVSPSAG